MFALCIPLNAQKKLTIEYEHLLNDARDQYGTSWKIFEKIISTNEESISYVRSIDTTFYGGKNDNNISQQASEYTLASYKDVKNQIFFSNCLFSKYNLSDNTYKIKWEIKPEIKTILNYECQLARGKLRGRMYSVYFTSEIPIKNGPYKFDGLPGLILEVSSDDKCVLFIARSITMSNEEIANPFLDKPFISWEIFSKNYKKYFDKMNSYKPEEDVTYSIHNRTVEYNFITD